MNRDDVLGRWLIVDWRQDYDDGRVTYPMGQGLRGFIEYGPHGMFCVIEKADRPPLAANQWTASAADQAAAYGSYFSYAGGWDAEPTSDDRLIVTHRVQHSLYPNWEGGVQRRHARLDNEGLLHLSARFEDGTAQARSASLIWRRAGT